MRCKSWQRSCGWRRVAESRLEYPNRFTHVNSKNPQINLLSLKPWNAHSLIKSLKSSRILFPPLPSHNPSPLQLSSQSHTIVLHPCADGVHWETEEKSGADHCNAGHPSWLYLYVQFVYIFKRAPFTWALVFGCEVCTHPQHRCNHVNVYACITLRVLCVCVCVNDDQLYHKLFVKAKHQSLCSYAPWLLNGSLFTYIKPGPTVHF